MAKLSLVVNETTKTEHIELDNIYREAQWEKWRSVDSRYLNKGGENSEGEGDAENKEETEAIGGKGKTKS